MPRTAFLEKGEYPFRTLLSRTPESFARFGWELLLRLSWPGMMTTAGLSSLVFAASPVLETGVTLRRIARIPERCIPRSRTIKSGTACADPPRGPTQADHGSTPVALSGLLADASLLRRALERPDVPPWWEWESRLRRVELFQMCPGDPLSPVRRPVPGHCSPPCNSSAWV